jgi:hypothetical protein
MSEQNGFEFLVEIMRCESDTCKNYSEYIKIGQQSQFASLRCCQLCAIVFEKGRVKLFCGNFEPPPTVEEVLMTTVMDEPALTVEEKAQKELKADLAQEEGEFETEVETEERKGE